VEFSENNQQWVSAPEFFLYVCMYHAPFIIIVYVTRADYNLYAAHYHPQTTGNTTTHGENFFQANKNWLIVSACFVGALILVVGTFLWSRRQSTPPSDLEQQIQEDSGPLWVTPSLGNNLRNTFEISLSEVKLEHRIGRGSAGDVFKAVWNGTKVAVKVLPTNHLNKGFGKEQFLKEAALMK
jgi:hypothetical protein